MKKALLNRISSIRLVYMAAFVFALCWLQYGNTLGHSYSLDDAIVIQSNPTVQKGIAGIPELFVATRSNDLSDQYGYRPLTLATFAIDVEIFGQNPFGGHLMSVFYFSLLCVILLFTLCRLFPEAGRGFAFIATILFVVHPLHVEAVANIKSRDEVLALLFALVALQFALRMFRNAHWGYGVGLLAMLGFSYLCKESALVFIAVIPMGLLIQSGNDWKKKIYFVIPVLIGAILTIGTIAWAGESVAVESADLEAKTGLFRESKLMGNAIFQPHNTIDRYATGTYIMGRYLKDFIAPYPLVYYHGYNYVPLTNWANVWVWLSLVAHLSLLFAAYRFFRTYRWVAFGILFYFITASPYSHFLRPLDDAMADRFMFTPSLGLIMLLVGGLALLMGVPADFMREVKPRNMGRQQNSMSFRSLFVPAMGILLVAGFTRTALRNTAWKDNLTLFSNDIKWLEEDCARCNFHYADALSREYQNKPHSPDIDQEIVRHFRKAIEISPQAYNSYISLGNTYYGSRDFDAGIKVFEDAMKNFPDAARPWFFIGKGYMMQKNPGEALPYLQKAKDMAPDREEHYFFLGWAWYQTSNQYKGIEIIRYAQSRWPGTLEYYNALSEMYWGIGEQAASLQALVELIGKAPDYREAYLRLIDRYRQTGDNVQADHYLKLGQDRGVLPR